MDLLRVKKFYKGLFIARYKLEKGMKVNTRVEGGRGFMRRFSFARVESFEEGGKTLPRDFPSVKPLSTILLSLLIWAPSFNQGSVQGKRAVY